ncbi:Aerotolerance protein BatB / Aerotolerance protein BatC [hydrothermal vent metagenome]|uniref:Aerotolerance protein BatB / Aerotolerance protein BatC n=1 Tax=hydrothermal vent metagenome TaxID=652676 RepID=A0A3B0Z8C6_9ZZZZ
MINFEDFHLLRPLWLLALVPLALLIVWLFQQKKTNNSWIKLCDTHLLPHLLQGSPTPQRLRPFLILACIWLLGVIALSGPASIKLPQPLFQTALYRVIILDLSRSMDASDLAPSRLSRAKIKLHELLQRNQDGQIALVVYANNAYVVSPLTQDSATIAALVPSLTTSLMPEQGSNTTAALTTAISLLPRSQNAHNEIILLTDGLDDPASALHIAQELKQQDITLFILGIGTKEGAPIPLQGGFLKDRQGNIVIPKLAPDNLQQLANAGGGRYVTISSDNRDIDILNTSSLFYEATLAEQQDLTNNNQWRDDGPWLLLLIAPLALLFFRRGILFVVPFIIITLPQPSYAFEWEDLFSRPDQQGQQTFNQQEHKKAAEQFNDPAWKASAYYKAQDYEKAAQHYRGINTQNGHYNLGNALAKQGKFQEAVNAYDEALKLNPEHENALYNQKLVQNLLKEQDQEQEQESDDASEDGDEHDSDKSESQDGNEDGENEQQNSDAQKEQDKNEGENNQESTSAQQNDAAKETPEEQQGQAEETTEDNKNQDGQTQEQTATEQVDQVQTESEQALEQWLRRIPDDPGGLLRRKFHLENLRRPNAANNSNNEW